MDGEKPLRGKAWEKVRTLYLPLNVKNKHWVSLAIQFDTWEILVFDCNINIIKDQELQKYIDPFRWMLPYLLRQSGKFVKYAHKYPEPFVCQRIKDLPQNHER